MNEALSSPINLREVSPEEVFSKERLFESQQHPAEIQDALGLTEVIESHMAPAAILTPNPLATRYQAERGYEGDSLKITHYPYETQEAHENPTTHTEDGAYLIAVEGYRDAATNGAHATETLLIDRKYKAFVRREELEDSGQRVRATIPAALSDVEAAYKRILGIKDERRPAPTAEQQAEIDEARAKIETFKQLLSSMPEFRQAVVDRLSLTYTADIPNDVVDKYVAAFWQGDDAKGTTADSSQLSRDNLSVLKSDKELVVLHRKEAVETTIDGKPDIAMDEVLDIALFSVGVKSRREWELNITTKPQGDWYQTMYAKYDAQGFMESQVGGKDAAFQDGLAEVSAFLQADTSESMLAPEEATLTRDLDPRVAATYEKESRPYTPTNASRGTDPIAGLAKAAVIHAGADVPIKFASQERPESASSQTLSPRRLTVASRVRELISKLTRR